MTEREKVVPVRRKIGIVLLGAGITLIVGLWIIENFFPIAGFETYSSTMLIFGIILAIIGFAAVTTSPGSLDDESVWSMKTGPVR